MKVVIIAFVVLYILFPLVRCAVNNLHLTALYGLIDTISYFKYEKYKAFDCFGIDMFVGEFGRGKTLSMTHRARLLYKRFGDRVRFISNYDLKGIPYTRLVNFNQLIDLGEDESNYEGTIVLIDEVENLLNNRNYAKFPLALLHTLMQQRKKHVYFLCSSPRYFMVDKLWRSITTNVYNCHKYWRFQHIEVYDAWDLENAMNFQNIKRKANIWWFVKNQDFNAYDTQQMITKDSAEQFISNEEHLQALGDQTVNAGAVVNVSKSVKRKDKKQNRRGR